MLKLNSQGMTLVEVMVAAAIVGIIALVMGTLFTQQANQQRNANFQATLGMLNTSIQSQVGNSSVIYQSSQVTQTVSVAADMATTVEDAPW